jgi:hypothetical protein
LTSENQVLKQQVSYFQENLANTSLVGGVQHGQSQPIDIADTFKVNQDQLDELKAEILAKINRRFFASDARAKSLDNE